MFFLGFSRLGGGVSRAGGSRTGLGGDGTCGPSRPSVTAPRSLWVGDPDGRHTFKTRKGRSLSRPRTHPTWRNGIPRSVFVEGPESFRVQVCLLMFGSPSLPARRPTGLCFTLQGADTEGRRRLEELPPSLLQRNAPASTKRGSPQLGQGSVVEGGRRGTDEGSPLSTVVGPEGYRGLHCTVGVRESQGPVARPVCVPRSGVSTTRSGTFTGSR